jgi:hypothetical protein
MKTTRIRRTRLPIAREEAMPLPSRAAPIALLTALGGSLLLATLASVALPLVAGA